MFDRIVLYEFVLLLKCYVYDKIPCTCLTNVQASKVKAPADPCYSLKYIFHNDTPF